MPDRFYMPPNATEGEIFTSRFCDRCEREALYRRTDDGCDACPILTMSLFGDQPQEWVVRDGKPLCTAFTPSREVA